MCYIRPEPSCIGSGPRVYERLRRLYQRTGIALAHPHILEHSESVPRLSLKEEEPYGFPAYPRMIVQGGREGGIL